MRDLTPTINMDVFPAGWHAVRYLRSIDRWLLVLWAARLRQPLAGEPWYRRVEWLPSIGPQCGGGGFIAAWLGVCVGVALEPTPGPDRRPDRHPDPPATPAPAPAATTGAPL